MAAPLFATAPREVIDYVDRRGVKTSWRWTDLAPHQHALNFTVARTAGFDVIGDLRDATRRASVDRVPFEQFTKDLIPILQQKGWWGSKVVTGPGGHRERVQLGSLRRLKTIYWANIRSSHAAGEWAKTLATRDVLPYLRYKISLAIEKRKEHLTWVGTTLPVSHRWWRTHYPPNGWHCECRTEQIGEAAADKMPAAKRQPPALNMRRWVDKRSGKVWYVPEGIDPGWQSNPGATREITARWHSRRVLHDYQMAHASSADDVRRAVEQIRTQPPFLAMTRRSLGYDSRRLSEPAMQQLRNLASPVAVIPEDVAAKLGIQDKIIDVTVGTIAKQSGRHPEVQPKDYDKIQEILDAPDHVQIAPDGNIEAWKNIDGVTWFIGIKDERSPPGGLRLVTLFVPKPSWLRKLASGVRNRDRSS